MCLDCRCSILKQMESAKKKSIVSELLWSLQRVWDYFFFFFFCKAKLSSVEIVIGIFLPMTLWYDMRKEQMFWQLMWTFGKISWLLSPVVSSWNLLWWHSKNVDLCLGPSMITVVDWRLKPNYFKKQSYSSSFLLT